MTSSYQAAKETIPTVGYRGWLLALTVSLATALLVASPLFWLGNASGHDFGFHAASWLDVANQWKEGIFSPRWAEWANYGFGEPRFIFYPPLSWMLGAALGFLFPWAAVPILFIVLAQTLAGLCAFALVRPLLPRRSALFATACYAANPYALLVVYMRSDFAEQLATALYPLLVLAALQLCGFLPSRGRPRQNIAFFSLIFALIWLANAPAGVIASYALSLLFIWFAIVGRSWQPVWRGACGLALGLGLAGIYILPAAYEQKWVNITSALAPGLLPAQNFLYTSMKDAEHNSFNHIASSLALLLFATTAVSAAIAFAGTELRDGSKKTFWYPLLLLGAVAFFLMLPISSVFWKLLPKLRFVQFPWRWMSILAVAYASFLAAAITRQRVRWIGMATVLLLTAGTGAFLVKRGWWDSEDIPVLREAIVSEEGFDGTDEYDPIGDDHLNLPHHAPYFELLDADSPQRVPSRGKVQVQVWNAETKALRASSREPLRLALRLLNYPAWRVEVNDAEVVPERADDFDQMIVPLPPGEVHVRVHFTRTLDRSLGAALSAIALVILVIGLLPRKPH